MVAVERIHVVYCKIAGIMSLSRYSRAVRLLPQDSEKSEGDRWGIKKTPLMEVSIYIMSKRRYFGGHVKKGLISKGTYVPFGSALY
ncbi:hypothetical protein [Bacillus rhizoplanae]|uniref:hypothetical protein n=1 Tax=Bacillus rhizoplanae TaxID=2880966 RepID=UPI003D1A8512